MHLIHSPPRCSNDGWLRGSCHRLALFIACLLIADHAAAICDPQQPTRTPDSRYEARGDQVYDRKTTLTWQRCSAGQQWQEDIGCVGLVQQMTFDEAVAAGGDGWRLPSRDELATLASPTCQQPAINESLFPDMDLRKLWYWTSTLQGEYLAWLVNFADGRFASFDRNDVAALRLVRDASVRSSLVPQEQRMHRKNPLHTLDQRLAGQSGS